MNSQPDPSFRRRAEVFGGGPTIVNTLGQPVPPSEVVDRLRRIDEGLSIEWVESAWDMSYFGLFQRWRQGDPRWERVQNGEIPESKARDLLTMFPRSCPAYEMAAWVEQRWGARAMPKDPRKEADRLMEEAKRLYAQVQDDNIQKVVDESFERLGEESSHSLGLKAGVGTAHPMVAGIGDGPKRLIPED